MYVFFDTETTGLPHSWTAPASQVRNWPRIVQLAWIVADENHNTIGPFSYIIKPDGFTIPLDATRKHGITTERAHADGRPLFEVLNEFQTSIEGSTDLVAHNVDFDSKVTAAEYIRKRWPNPVAQMRLRCTMKETTDLCRLPGNYGYKWPTLTELHRHLFQCSFDGAHDAGNDCAAGMKCFLRLLQIGAM